MAAPLDPQDLLRSIRRETGVLGHRNAPPYAITTALENGRRSRGRRGLDRRASVESGAGRRIVAAYVEPEWRVGVGHQRGVGRDAEDPAIHAEHEVIERLGVAA